MIRRAGGNDRGGAASKFDREVPLGSDGTPSSPSSPASLPTAATCTARLPFPSAMAGASSRFDDISAIQGADSRSGRRDASPRAVSPDGIYSAGPAASFLPRLKELYDAESDQGCRMVRRGGGGKGAGGGGRRGAGGADAEKGNRADERADGPEGDEVQTVLERAKERLLFASCLPGMLRAGRGSKVCPAASTALNPPRPAKPLILYSYEGNQFCRLLREILTKLNLPYELRSAGKGSPRREELAAMTRGSSRCPYLIDPNTGASMPESTDIAEYLYSTYALWTPPSELLRTASDVVAPLLAPLHRVVAPLQAGPKRDNEYKYASDDAEAKAEVYEEISSRLVVICELSHRSCLAGTRYLNISRSSIGRVQPLENAWLHYLPGWQQTDVGTSRLPFRDRPGGRGQRDDSSCSKRQFQHDNYASAEAIWKGLLAGRVFGGGGLPASCRQGNALVTGGSLSSIVGHGGAVKVAAGPYWSCCHSWMTNACEKYNSEYKAGAFQCL
ncbi:hypothetical protein ACHAWF_005338 [Thalassiosira exigua]